MYIVRVLKVVTSGMRSDVFFCRDLKHSDCDFVSTLCMSFKTSFLLYPHATKYSEYSLIRSFSVLSDEHMRVLVLDCKGCSASGGVGVQKSSGDKDAYPSVFEIHPCLIHPPRFSRLLYQENSLQCRISHG